MREYQYFLDNHPHIFSHLILWMTVFFIIIAGLWAHYSTLDEVTRGVGKVIPSSHVQIVQNLEGGIVAEILVKEGDVVKPGQILLRIDDTRFASSYRENQSKSTALQAKIARLSAEAQGNTFLLPANVKADQKDFFTSEQVLAQSRQQELQANLEVLNQQKSQKQQEINELKSKQAQLQQSYDLAQQELKITEPLVKQGVMSEIDLLRLQRQVNDLKGNLEATRLSIPRAESAVTEVDHKITEAKLNFRSRALAELNEAKSELSRSSESNLALEDRVTRTTVRSPVKGTIKQLKVTTIGGVVQPGVDLVEIVPLEDNLLIEAQIRPSDIAFLHPGQTAMVKFTAYDFSIYGGLKAHLEHISADTIVNEQGEPFFLIRLRTEHNYLRTASNKLPIIAGMTVIIDILTGKKTLLDYLLKPIRKAQEQALRER
ncbi:MAG: hemolysin secretion protein D [Beggiatoa sp. IS2]|nr:MAG: hemolysin secretion protein D [Beggiatoa sp. IS2]